MQTFFYVCFGVGIGYTVIAFVLGEALNLIDFDFDTDFEIGGFISPLKPSVIAAFITVFGGVGIIMNKRFGVLPSLLAAFLLGLAVAFLIYRFIIIPLHKFQNTSAVEKQSLIGHDAKVTVSIPANAFGKIVYYENGNTYSAPAKTENGSAIKREEQVVIVYIDKNTYYVRPKYDYDLKNYTNLH